MSSNDPKFDKLNDLKHFSNMIDGKKCLLLAICESAKHPLLESNGVLGHVLHIVLT